MQGKITKGIAGFYYVHIPKKGIYECRAKGIFRKEGIKPLVGDNVEVDILSEEPLEGNIAKICPRSNVLIRPAVANVDQALIIFSIVRPNPNFNLLDRFLITMEEKNLPTVICFNKSDIASKADMEHLKEAYENIGYRVLFTSAQEQDGILEMKEALNGKTTTVAGPSGVGKSSLINELQSGISMETGTISKKIERGKHTTRHSELISIDDHTYIMDTPGFSSLTISDIDKEKLSTYYKEFRQYERQCRFGGCAHIHEPDCGVKQALAEGKISHIRYDNYVVLYEELKEHRRY